MRRALPLFLALTTISCTSARLTGRNVAAATVVAGAAVLLDDEIAEAARKNDGPVIDSVLKAVEPFGGGHSDKVMAGFLLYGIAARDAKARAVAFESIAASVIAAKGITPALKEWTDRERPNGGDEPSFPSGHATQAFAVASVVASHYEQRWVRWLAYGIATTVGVARVYHDAHWTTDVLAGAAIGTAVGKTVVAANRRWTIVPTRNGVIVSLHW